VIKEIENGFIGALTAQVPSLKTVRGYNGDFDDVSEETLGQLILQFPAALVFYSASVGERSGSRRQRTLTYGVVLAGKSLRGEGDPSMRQGLYDLLEDVRNALDGSTLELAIRPLYWQRDRLLFHSAAFSVYAQEYTTHVND